MDGGRIVFINNLLSISVRSSVSPITPVIGDIIGLLVLTAEAQMTVHG